jgi:hypothetical protein
MHIADWHACKARAVCIHRENAELSATDTAKYDEVVLMDETIEVFRDVYAFDLACRLEIDKRLLPPAYTIMAVLNPMFGLEPSITGSGLMTKAQYSMARECLLRVMQDDFDAKNPL